MTEHVLVPYDGSAAADRALGYARDTFPNARVTLLYVMDPFVDHARRQSYPGYTRDDEFGNERQKAEHVLERGRAESAEMTDLDTAIVGGDPTREIVRYVDATDVDQIVIGSHQRQGAARFLLGSVAEAVVRRSRVPVTVVRPTE